MRFFYPRGWGEVERRTGNAVQTFRFRRPPDADGEPGGGALTGDLD